MMGLSVLGPDLFDVSKLLGGFGITAKRSEHGRKLLPIVSDFQLIQVGSSGSVVERRPCVCFCIVEARFLLAIDGVPVAHLRGFPIVAWLKVLDERDRLLKE